MRTTKKCLCSFLFCLSLVGLISCKKDLTTNKIAPEIIHKISELGFNTDDLHEDDGGYITEDDIILSKNDIDTKPQLQYVRIAGSEQYSTFNLIKNLPRTLTITISNELPFTYTLALDEAIRRYNAENLQVHFQRGNTDGDIRIINSYGNYVGASGLPSSEGVPYHTIKLNSMRIGFGADKVVINYIATLIAHEMGHCIGFRHTDYMNRSFSCKGKSANESAGSSGVINIAGTPSSPDAGSWMLACIDHNQNRNFNDNDRIALNYLY